MSRRVLWPPPAEQDLNSLSADFARSSSAVAERFLAALQAACQQLAEMPELGGLWESRHRRLAGLRVWPIRGFEQYLLFYRPTEEAIEIVRLLHGARDLDKLLGGSGSR